jgi:molybdopterin molybdotransferase
MTAPADTAPVGTASASTVLASTVLASTALASTVPTGGLKPVGAHLADIAATIRPLAPRPMTLDEADNAVLADDIPPLPAGAPLGPAELGMLAAAGHRIVLARPCPRVTVLSAGNEFVQPGRAVLPGQIWESNSFMLAAAARRLGCTVRRYPLARDDESEVRAAIETAFPQADLLVTSGGISMGGEHDVFKAALQSLDDIRFARVAMQPGMPQGFGTVGEPPTPILLLPGNPASAFVSFCLYAGPAVRALRGLDPLTRPAVSAVLRAPVRSRAGKASFVAGSFDPATRAVTPLGKSSHQLTALARANVLIVVPPPVTELGPGDLVELLELP